MRKIIIACVVAAFALLGGAVPASADHSGNPNTENLEHVVFSHDSDCGTASVTVMVPDETPATWQYGAAVTVDGAAEGSVLQVGPGTASLDLTFDEDQGDGSVLVEYSLEHATESDLLDGFEGGSFEVDTDCEDPKDEDPKDEDPVVSDCDAYADSDGWCEEGVEDYNCPDIDDAHKPITVIDVTEDPFGLDGDNDGLGCELDGTDDGNDEDETLVPVPVEIPAGAELPKTGVSPMLIGLGGLGLLGAGGGLLAWQRRRVTSS